MGKSPTNQDILYYQNLIGRMHGKNKSFVDVLTFMGFVGVLQKYKLYINPGGEICFYCKSLGSDKKQDLN